MFGGFRKTLAVTAVLLGALAGPAVLSAPAQADAASCLEFLRSVTGSEPTAEMERACDEADFNGEEGEVRCRFMLDAEGFSKGVQAKACGLGAA